MSEAGSGSPASRKHSLVSVPASPAAAFCGGGDGGDAAGGGSDSPRAKRRLFAAGGGGGALPAWSGRRASTAAAEMDQIKLARRLVIIQGAALAVVTASVWFLQVMRQKGYSAQQLAPLHAALADLTSAIRAATAPAEPHPDLYPTVMGIPGFHP